MDPLYLAYCVSLFLAPIVFYILLSKPKTHPAYIQPVYYRFAKSLFAKSRLKKYQRKWAEALKSIPDVRLENPKQNMKRDEVDSQIIYAADTKGNYFWLKITLRASLHAEVTVEYRQKDGVIYKFANEPEVLLCSIASRKWKGGGLNIEILQPFQRLRITYNGLMKNSRGDIEHVKFHFLWNSASAPLHRPRDVNANLLAKAVAKESWGDATWLDMLKLDCGYDQFGALIGFFNAKSVQEDNLHMPSWRRRRIERTGGESLKKDMFIFAILRDGTAFAVGAKSTSKGRSELPYGCIFTNNGYLHSISSSDISLENLTNGEEIPTAFSVHFQAGAKSYKYLIHINTHRIRVYNNSQDNGWSMKTATGECAVNSVEGNSVVTYWCKKKGNLLFDLPPPLLKPISKDDPKEVYVAQLVSVECLDINLSGGKGNSLGMMSNNIKSNEFRIPPGFVITTTAYEHQLQENPLLLEAIKNLEDICYKRKEGDVEDACKKTAELFSKTLVANKISKLIVEEINQTQAGGTKEIWRWAVRSSGLDEDSEELSAAGQNTTVLGCKTHTDIFNAVCCCWGSLFAFQSVEYRRQHGIPISTKMAVVVQKMIPADCAGVLFTNHPFSGDPTQMVITSNYGLGESVVSGSVDPDSIILTRNYKDEISISKIEIGKKNILIALSDDKVQQRTVEETLSKKLSITEDQAIRLGKVGVLLEKRFGNPRDIEWAYFNDTLYLLQSRPITTLNGWTDWELQHEFDTPVYAEDSLYTRANVGEVCKGAVTVLSHDVVTKIMDFMLQTVSYGRSRNPYAFGPVAIASHTLFLEVITYMYATVKKTISLENQVVDLAIFGHPVMNENIHKVALKRHGPLKGLKQIKHLLTLVYKSWNNPKSVEAVSRFNNFWEINLDSCKTPARMLEEVEKQFDKLESLFEYHLNASLTSVAYQMAAMITLTENSAEFEDEHYTDVALLLSTNVAVESAEIPVILEEITSNIKNLKLAKQFARIDPKSAMNWLNENCPEIKKQIDNFLLVHGHRSFSELEFKEDTWAMDPSALIVMVQANCLAETTTKKAQGLTVDETIAKLTSPKKNITKLILKFLVKKCREAVASREKSKSELIRGINRFRIAYREIGKHMVLHGCTPEEDLVFHLTHSELKAIATWKNPSLVQKALRRKRLYAKWNQLKFSELNFGVPIPEQEKSDLYDISSCEGGVKLKGTPVYEGNVISRACVIIDVKDAKAIQQGDILITNSTDIGWSPYFPLLSGVVTELGGLISHGAVVAREYGLPCIVGVENATRYFKTGDKIRLSGKTGLLELLE